MWLTLQKAKELHSLSTLGIGGKADLFVEVHTILEMQFALSLVEERGLRFWIVGHGSNTLFDDRGFRGLVIKNHIDFCEEKEGRLHVGAGHSFSALGMRTASQNWGGLEFAASIPGTVGGAVYMNAGCHGGMTSHHLVSVGYVDRGGGFMTLGREQLTFGDRYSSFHEMDGAIVSAMFQLVPDDRAKDRQREWSHYRLKAHPMQERSGGCVFRNFPDLSAGALIDRCGLKGTRRGDAQVATQHANFIINRGRATSKEVLDLIDEICQVVRAKSQRELTLELCVAPY